MPAAGAAPAPGSAGAAPPRRAPTIEAWTYSGEGGGRWSAVEYAPGPVPQVRRRSGVCASGVCALNGVVGLPESPTDRSHGSWVGGEVPGGAPQHGTPCPSPGRGSVGPSQPCIRPLPCMRCRGPRALAVTLPSLSTPAVPFRPSPLPLPSLPLPLSSPPAQPRLTAQAAVLGGGLWLVGGWDPSAPPDGANPTAAFLNDVWRLDLRTWAWQQVRCGCGCVGAGWCGGCRYQPKLNQTQCNRARRRAWPMLDNGVARDNSPIPELHRVPSFPANHPANR